MLKFFFVFFFLPLGFCYNINVTNKNALYKAFTNVFQINDEIQMNNDVVLKMAILELQKLGMDDTLQNMCSLKDEVKFEILMKAALGEYLFSLKDPNDWSIIVIDVENGQFTRKRSFSNTRFAVLETLLIISVLALGRLLWLK